MRQYIQAVIKPPYLDWEIYLPALRIAYNTSVSKATKKSPFSLLFAMKPQMPFFDFEPEFSYSEDYYDRLAALEKARAEAVENNLLYKEMYAAQYNARHNVQQPSLSVGDLILVEARPDQQHRNAKLHNLYDGPFPIVRISAPNVYYQRGKKIFVTHINRIKKVNSPIALETREGACRVQQAALPRPSGAEGKPMPMPNSHSMHTRSKTRTEAFMPPPARVFHSMEAQPGTQAQQHTLSTPVVLHNSVPDNTQDMSDMIFVDGSDALAVTDDGLVVLPELDDIDDVETRRVVAPETEFQDIDHELSLNPEASAFVDKTQMDTNEMSHFYANDQSLRSLHSLSLAEEPQAQSIEEPVRVYTQRSRPHSPIVPIPSTSGPTKRKELLTSPPHLPVAKRTQGSPSKSVRESLVDICLRPTRFLRSSGTVPDVPNIPFPAEYRSYRRELERLEAQNEAERNDPQNVADPQDVPHS